MKIHMKTKVLIMAAMAAVLSSSAQTVSSFENLTLSTDSFWDGRANTSAGGFTSGNAFFTNKWDTSFGGFWAGGFAYTNKKDSTDGTYNNLYSAITAGGYSSSANYVVGQQDAIIRLSGNAHAVTGVYVTNATYPYKTIKNGNGFAKKFGGATGNDPDYFMMAFTAWKLGVKKPDTVKFYLADFRFSNNSQDYIINSWSWVDLSPLGYIDSLQVSLFSSDTAGGFGINTPLFYAMDNFTTTDLFVSSRNKNAGTIGSAYPNPFMNELKLNNSSDEEMNVAISDLSGRIIHELKIPAHATAEIASLAWAKGVYFAHMKNEQSAQVYKLIKQ
jgi:hypothetical protein